jgi:hypothetical protein
MVQSSTLRRPDLFEVRRQLVRARNRHSNNRAIVRRINSLLCRIYHLKAIDAKQSRRIREAVQIVLRDTSNAVN